MVWCGAMHIDRHVRWPTCFDSVRFDSIRFRSVLNSQYDSQQQLHCSLLAARRWMFLSPFVSNQIELVNLIGFSTEANAPHYANKEDCRLKKRVKEQKSTSSIGRYRVSVCLCLCLWPCIQCKTGIDIAWAINADERQRPTDGMKAAKESERKNRPKLQQPMLMRKRFNGFDKAFIMPTCQINAMPCIYVRHIFH